MHCLIIILLHQMAYTRTAALLVVLFGALCLAAPIAKLPHPLKLTQFQLRSSPSLARESQNVFEVAENYRSGDRWALSMTSLKFEGSTHSFEHVKMKWEVIQMEKQNRVLLETPGSSSQSHFIVEVSLMIIGKQWEEKVIFLQNLKVTPTSNIKQLDNGILLTTASSHKFGSAKEIYGERNEVFVLHRGFEGQEGPQAIMSLQGYFIDSQHIHIYSQLKNVIHCYVTLMVINRTQLTRLQIQLVQIPIQSSLIQGISWPKGELSFAECISSLSSEDQQECWLMKPPQFLLQLRRVLIETVEDRPQYDLADENQLEEFSLHGRNRLLSPCVPKACTCNNKQLYATSCYEDNTCKCKISSCGPGYYTTAKLVSSCTLCPTNLTYCTSCGLQYGTTNVTCTVCSPGYTVLNKVCVACPIGCATCTTTLVNMVTTVTCQTCLTTLTLQTSGSIKICGCTSNQFLNTSASPIVCVTCPISCISCTSPTTCTVCSVGYYMSATSCLACMPVCKTCSNAGSCLTCTSPATLVTGVCTCPALTFFNINTKTCLTCSTIQQNCLSCDYSSGFLNTTNPSQVVCNLASTGFYITGSGSTAACISYCLSCSVAPPVCDNCNTNFAYSIASSSCLCIAGLYFSTTQKDCLACATVIPGCNTCQINTIPTATTCQSCSSGFFAATYPSLACTACPTLCLTCTSLTNCVTCVNNLTVISGGMCGCNSGASLFLNPTALTCESCGTAIFGCQVCNGATGVTTCTTASAGFYIVAGSTACSPCPATCSACSATACTACDNGYALSSGSCSCDLACNTCLINNANTCSSCDAYTYACYSCAVGYYNYPACTPCTNTYPKCLDCTTTSCMACTSTFTLTSTGCFCDNSAGLYLSVNTLTCQTCSTVIPNCQTCTNAGPTTTTVCSVATPGYYVSSSQTCTICGGACLTCSISSTHCITCLVTYTMFIPNTCGCNNTANLYYNPSTTGCSLCTSIIPNCQTCSTTALITTCTLCSGLYYWNSTSFTCDACSSSCTTCSSSSVCTGCPNNLVLSQTVTGYVSAGVCVCDNNTLPLTYYDSTTGNCEPCTYFYTTCTSCYLNGSTVLCSAASGSTYIVSGATVNCPSPCSTCDATGCLTCPTGMNPINGSCVCNTACTNCETLSIGCVSCSISAGAITSCSACLPGTYLSSPNCLSCPATCVTCTSSTTCVTCQPSYVLIGSMCSCPLTLGIFPNSVGVCTACSTIYYACNQCQISSGSTVCVACASGYYLSGGQCLACSTGCATCSVSAITCTSCAIGQTLTPSATCTCTSADCMACNTVSPNCATCVYTIYGIFIKCETCQPDYYINGANCSPCPTTCQSCGTGGACLTCPNTFEVIGGNCVCNSAKNMWKSAGSCSSCSTVYPNCNTCTQNATAPLNVTCLACETNYFLLASGSCTSSVCGDSLVTSGQTCDDGNAASGDGCSDYCQVELNFVCTGQPSVCRINLNFYITLKSINTNTAICNQFDISFDMYPIYSSYDSANFYNMLSFVSEASLIYKSWSYSSGVVTYTFDYSLSINKETVSFYFSPKSLGVSDTASIPLVVVDVEMYPTNNIQLIYYEQSTCKTKKGIQKMAKAVEYASYGTLIASALPCKIVGLELFGVLQLAHINVGNMDYVNTMMTPLMGMKGVHGFSFGLGSEDKKSRMLQATGYTPSRVQSIGYESNFLRNCNAMLMVVIVVILVSFSLYLGTWACQKCAPCLHSISKRIIKEVLLTLILFNCFNFAYSAGLHFRYAPTDDSLYNAGTASAIIAIILPVLMALALMCTEDDGFGEYKEKFKSGLVNRLYFVVTILYRTGIGLYISSSNEDSMSTLIVMGLSIAFLLYNLVNLPYTKAYHNYRANVCHFTQFICLFVAMYYRSMMSSTPNTDMATVFSPVYLEMGAILISLIVSVVVLIYEIYLFVLECMQKNEDKNKITKVSDESSFVNEKQITEGQLDSFTNEKKLSFDEQI